jgi:DNA-binding LacI/PurR family transcriptional regulator
MRKRQPVKKKMIEVARRAGVSPSTVSRALAGSPLISEETRALVREAAASLDYRVHAAGSSLRSGTTRTVGVVIPLSHAEQQNFSDPFFLEILGAIADELAGRGYSMLLSKVTHDPTDWITTVIEAGRADGAVVIGQSLHHEALDALAVTGAPFVVWGARQGSQRYVSVGSDNEAGGYSATSHLLAQGCRRIAFLGDSAVPEVAARLEGHVRALRAAGRRRTPRLELPVRFGGDGDSTDRAIGALLATEAELDGVVACSDVLAMRAMRTLAEHGRQVPTDVAIVGYDDIPFAALTTPPLTTVRQNCRQGARLLVEKLMSSIRREPTDSVVIPTEIVVRASSLRRRYRSLPSIRAAAKPSSSGSRLRRSRGG